MSKLRTLARGRECQVRLPQVCNHNPETVVLGHYRLAGTCGVGIKPPDLLGAWMCSECHSAVDGRLLNSGTALLTRNDLRLAHAEGVLRTIAALIKENKIKA